MSKVKEPGIRQRATRRGVRSLDGKFYHTRKERNDADKAFNRAIAEREARTKTVDPAVIRQKLAAEPFDFTYNEGITKPDIKIVTPSSAHYHCNNCQTSVEYKAPICPKCGGKLNWEGFE